MAKHQRTPQDKQADIYRKHRKKRQQKSQNQCDKSLTYDKSLFPGSETPFHPRMDEHATTLSRIPFSVQRQEFISRLQHTYGNRYVQRLMESMKIQAKLTVSEPNDIYEQEADKVAEEVTRSVNTPVLRQEPEEDEELMRGKLLQRQSPEEEEELVQGKFVQRQAPEEEEELIQGSFDIQRQEPEEEELQMQTDSHATSTVASDIESRINSARGDGQPLLDEVREPMEQALGADFSGVRTHTDKEADTLNQKLSAKAFTTGQDVFFRDGEYSPGSDSGKKLIAHELTHVVQQNLEMVNKREESVSSEQSTVEQKESAGQLKPVDNDKNRQALQRMLVQRSIMCPICGEENEDDAVTCTSCGAPLTSLRETETLPATKIIQQALIQAGLFIDGAEPSVDPREIEARKRARAMVAKGEEEIAKGKKEEQEIISAKAALQAVHEIREKHLEEVADTDLMAKAKTAAQAVWDQMGKLWAGASPVHDLVNGIILGFVGAAGTLSSKVSSALGVVGLVFAGLEFIRSGYQSIKAIWQRWKLSEVTTEGASEEELQALEYAKDKKKRKLIKEVTALLASSAGITAGVLAFTVAAAAPFLGIPAAALGVGLAIYAIWRKFGAKRKRAKELIKGAAAGDDSAGFIRYLLSAAKRFGYIEAPGYNIDDIAGEARSLIEEREEREASTRTVFSIWSEPLYMDLLTALENERKIHARVLEEAANQEETADEIIRALGLNPATATIEDIREALAS